MNKNFFLTLAAIAVMVTLGYAAYTNGSITDLSSVINNQLSGITSVGSNFLGALVTTTSPAGKPSLNISVNPSQKMVNILPAQTAVIFASYVLDARKSSEDVAVYNLTFSPAVSKNGYVDDIRNCQLISENNALVSDQIGTLFGGDVSFRLHNENSDPANPASALGLLVLKGTKNIINLKCDVAVSPNSASGSAFRFAVKKSGNNVDSAIGLFSKNPAVVNISSVVSPSVVLRYNK